nr:hypothetical protein [uncultured Roseateles sp.]
MTGARSNLRDQRRRTLRMASGLALTLTLPLALRPLSAQTAASPAARLRLRALPGPRGLEVGDVITVRLEVWVSTWFQSAVDFPATLSAEGALVEMVGGSPESSFEEIAGQRWTGLIRQYRVAPVQPGEVVIALSSALAVHPGAGNPMQLKPPPALRMNVKLPKGAEDIQPFVAARRLELSQRWWPEAPANSASDAAGNAAVPRVGDLIRREIVLITDSSSPLLPLPDLGLSGEASEVGVHLHAPELEERRINAATTPVQTRRQQATYTLRQAGVVEFPALELVWWDLRARRRRVSRLEGLTLQVQAAAQARDPFAIETPAEALPAKPKDSGIWQASWRSKLLIIALLAAGGLGAAVALRRQRRSRPSEQQAQGQAWRRLRRACSRGDAGAADQALAIVMATQDTGLRQHWLRDRELQAAMNELAQRRFGASAPAESGGARWQGDRLWRALSKLRREHRRTAKPAQLPALSP